MYTRNLGSVKRASEAYDKLLDAAMREHPTAKWIAIRIRKDPPPGRGAHVDLWAFETMPNDAATVDLGIDGPDVLWFEKPVTH